MYIFLAVAVGIFSSITSLPNVTTMQVSWRPGRLDANCTWESPGSVQTPTPGPILQRYGLRGGGWGAIPFDVSALYRYGSNASLTPTTPSTSGAYFSQSVLILHQGRPFAYLRCAQSEGVGPSACILSDLVSLPSREEKALSRGLTLSQNIQNDIICVFRKSSVHRWL